MIRQSRSNRNDSTTSEFQKSMLSKLDTLCSPNPTFDSVDSETSLSFNISDTSANMRRRRLYHSPGALGALQSPANALASAALAAREESVKSFGNILAERARLVQKTLTRNALASQHSSTPIRPSTSTHKPKTVSVAEHLGAGSASSQSVNTPARLIDRNRRQKLIEAERAERSDNMILKSLSALESSGAHNGLLTIAEKSQSFTRSVCSRGTQSMACSDADSSEDSIPSSEGNSSTTKWDVAAIDSLKLNASFSLKRRRKDRSLRWFAVVCSCIKRLISCVPSPSEDVSRCTCLQLALVATKRVSSDHANWLPEFIEHIIQLGQAAGECSLHKRCSKSLIKEKQVNINECQSLLDEDRMSCIVNWLRDSRSRMMERLAANLQLLL